VNRVGFVRADATGCSQVIAPDGRILGQSPLFAADALVRDIPLGFRPRHAVHALGRLAGLSKAWRASPQRSSRRDGF
jgi:apolipoprotein N-acyltransferase